VLEWQLKNANKLQRLDYFRRMKEAGQSVPFLDDEPELDPRHLWAWEGFITLIQQRATGHEGVPQPIPMSEIKAYVDYVGMADEADREDFLYLVLRLDSIALNYSHDQIRKQREKAQKEAKRKQQTSGRSRRR
jgi:hypothetical protein